MTRIIITSVSLPEISEAIRLATAEYQRRFNRVATNVSLPRAQWPENGRVEVDGRELSVNRHPASPGTVQAGE